MKALRTVWGCPGSGDCSAGSGGLQGPGLTEPEGHSPWFLFAPKNDKPVKDLKVVASHLCFRSLLWLPGEDGWRKVGGGLGRGSPQAARERLEQRLERKSGTVETW